jgi:hypothetical protein
MDVVSALTGFLLGAATGSAGTYFAGVFTDQRKRQEVAKAELRTFTDLATQMPDLFRELKADLESDGQTFTREVFLMPRGAVLGGFDNPAHFRYTFEEHAALREKFALLEHAQLVADVTPGNTPKFRLSEPFVALLRRWRAD